MSGWWWLGEAKCRTRARTCPLWQGSPGWVVLTQPLPLALLAHESVEASQPTSCQSTALRERGSTSAPCPATTAASPHPTARRSIMSSATATNALGGGMIQRSRRSDGSPHRFPRIRTPRRRLDLRQTHHAPDDTSRRSRGLHLRHVRRQRPE